MPANPALGIDFGTSNTTAVLRRSDGRVETVMFDGSPLLPSAVFAEADGTILVGRDAIDSARQDPARFEPHPKRRVDDGVVLLGDREIPVGELFTAVLGRVRRECRQILGALPPTIVLTHPAAWGPTRRLVLQEAARAAGLPDVTLVPEPVAAAAYYVAELGNRIPVGSAVVVHDFGGGTFDASVVRRTAQGFDVLAVDGLDDLGGRDIDQAIVNRLRESVGAGPEWDRLLRPTTAAERRQWRSFHDDVRAAKERLSRNSTADLYLPVLDREVHFTREELETLTAPLLARAPGIVKGVIRASGLPESAIAGVFLVGGASRMPLAATMLHRELGRPPTVIDRLEQVVAHGALLTEAMEAPVAEPYRPMPTPYQPVPPRPSPTRYQPLPPEQPAQTPPIPLPEINPARKQVRPRAAHAVLGTFAAGWAVLPPFAIDMYLPGLPAIAAESGTDETGAQFTLSSLLLGAALAILTTRRLSDRIGRRRPLLIATALFAFSSLTAALAPGLTMLNLARFGQGLAGAACMVLIRAILHDRDDGPRLARSLAILGGTLGAATVAAPLLGGAVATSVGWRPVFAFLLALGAIAWAVVLFGVQETLPKEQRGTQRSRADRPPLGITITVVLCAAATFLYLGGSSFIFMNRFGAPPSTYGLVLATTATAALIGGTLSRRGKQKRPLYIALVVAAFGALLLATIGNLSLALAWAALMITLIGLGAATPAALAAAQPAIPAGSTPIAALSCLTGAIAAPLAGLLGNESFLPMAAAMLAALTLAALAATRSPKNAIPATVGAQLPLPAKTIASPRSRRPIRTRGTTQ
jgi:predicted MFS family arabinose efflux permease